MHKKTANILRLMLAALLIAVVVIFAFWLPSMHDYTEKLTANNFSFLYKFFYPLCAILFFPFLLMIILAFGIPKAMKNDNIFSKSTARLLLVISLLIILECMLLSVLVLFFFVLNDPMLALPFTFLSMIGFVLSAMLIILADYVKRAAEIKERIERKK